MLAVEVDGWETRKTYGAFQRDTARQNALVVEGGWAVIRFTWTDVVRRPGYVAAQIAAAARASPARFRTIAVTKSRKGRLSSPTTDVRSGAMLRSRSLRWLRSP